MQPTFNPLIKSAILLYPQDPPQSLLIVGPKGAGKGLIMQQIIKEMKNKYTKIESYIVAPDQDKKTISIDQIKLLITSLRSKKPYHTIITIEDADLLTIEAQNSLLKLLEEPPVNVHFLLTTSFSNSILTTIKSRVIIWRYIAPSKSQQLKYISSFNTSQSQESLLALSGGRMGLLSALLEQNNNHPLKQAIEQSKEVLSESIQKRILRIDMLAKDVSKTEILLDALLLVCVAATKKSIYKGAKYSQWLSRAKNIEEAIKLTNARVQSKLVLTKLFLVL